MSGKFPKIPKLEIPKLPKLELPKLPKSGWPKMPSFKGENIFAQIKNIFGGLLKQRPGGSSGSGVSVPGRPMKFPYTFSAKIAQFPWRFYYKHNWMVRYYPYGVLGSLPVFFVLHRLANSKENKAHFREMKRKEKEAVHNKFL